MALMMVMGLSSCATIISGGSPKIILEGENKEPLTIVTEKEIYKDVNLPYVVKVKRHKLDGQRITIKSENHAYQDILLQKSVNEWAFGNILFGGLVGWGVDLLTNSVSKPKETRFGVVEVPYLPEK